MDRSMCVFGHANPQFPLPARRRLRRINSLAPSESSSVQVETLDLLHACPIWHADYLSCGGAPAVFWRRVFRLRERWSHRTVVIAAPCDRNEILAADWHTSWQLLAYSQCRTTVLWRAVGPPELLADLRGNNSGRPLPWHRSNEEVAEAAPLSLFLCQHEIRGD
jgi:hypothetical protein